MLEKIKAWSAALAVVVAVLWAAWFKGKSGAVDDAKKEDKSNANVIKEAASSARVDPVTDAVGVLAKAGRLRD